MTKDIISSGTCELYAPELAREELLKHSSLIVKKTGISELLFRSKLSELALVVHFVSIAEYKEELKHAGNALFSLSKDEQAELSKDIDFIALALKLNCIIWSMDKLLKKQRAVEIVTKAELSQKFS